MKMAERMARVSLESCDAPGKGDDATGAFDGLYRVFTAGPIRQYLVLEAARATSWPSPIRLRSGGNQPGFPANGGIRTSMVKNI